MSGKGRTEYGEPGLHSAAGGVADNDAGADPGPETGLVAISRNGAQLAGKLVAAWPGDAKLHVVARYRDSAQIPDGPAVATFTLPLRPVIGRVFARYRRLVLFMPVGAAVRLLAPHLRHKRDDPAVVCVDDAGRFAVSLLSGHVGGADDLAGEVAGIIGAMPVITSASHVMDTLAVDLLGREFGWQIEADSATVTRVSAAVVNGNPVGLFQETGERHWWPAGKPLPGPISVYASLEELLNSDSRAALLITDRELSVDSYLVPGPSSGPDMEKVTGKVVMYRPRSLVVGIGCRRGVSRQHLEELLVSVFRRHNLSLRSVKCIATAEVKRDEPGILELAEKYGVPVVCFDADALNDVFETVREGATAAGRNAGESSGNSPTPSAARRLLGIWGVSEPAALLASGSSELLVSREKTDRATIAVARIPFNDNPAA